MLSELNTFFTDMIQKQTVGHMCRRCQWHVLELVWQHVGELCMWWGDLMAKTDGKRWNATNQTATPGTM